MAMQPDYTREIWRSTMTADHPQADNERVRRTPWCCRLTGFLMLGRLRRGPAK
jgi:hypothetical protein